MIWIQVWPSKPYLQGDDASTQDEEGSPLGFNLV